MGDAAKHFLRGYIRALFDVFSAIEPGARARYYQHFITLLYQIIDEIAGKK